jgi:hypothetical protein
MFHSGINRIPFWHRLTGTFAPAWIRANVIKVLRVDAGASGLAHALQYSNDGGRKYWRQS